MELNEKVQDMKLEKGQSISQVVQQMRDSGGFSAKKLGVAAEILTDMIASDKSINFLSFPACIISTGTRGIIRDMVKNRMFDVIPMKKFGEIQDIANAVIFLCGPESSYITGQVISVNGGMYM